MGNSNMGYDNSTRVSNSSIFNKHFDAMKKNTGIDREYIKFHIQNESGSTLVNIKRRVLPEQYPEIDLKKIKFKELKYVQRFLGPETLHNVFVKRARPGKCPCSRSLSPLGSRRGSPKTFQSLLGKQKQVVEVDGSF